MKQIKLTIEGEEYPCSVNGGALLEFERITGRDVSQMREGNMSDALAYLYCCVKWTCRREGIEWPYATLDDFAAVVGLGDIRRWSEQLAELVLSAMGGDDADDEQKKMVH